jgi:hypothetical protein
MALHLPLRETESRERYPEIMLVSQYPLIGTLEGQLTDGRRGNHRSEGFLITMGAGFDHGTDASPLHITELAPMVFKRLLGI